MPEMLDNPLHFSPRYFCLGPQHLRIFLAYGKGARGKQKGPDAEQPQAALPARQKPYIGNAVIQMAPGLGRKHVQHLQRRGLMGRVKKLDRIQPCLVRRTSPARISSPARNPCACRG